MASGMSTGLLDSPTPLPRTFHSVTGLSSPTHSTAMSTRPSKSELPGDKQTANMTKMNMEIWWYREKLGKHSHQNLKHSNNKNACSFMLENGNEATKDVSEIPSCTALNELLKDAINKNNQWQAYDVQRENYVRNLHQKYDSLSLRFQELNTNYVHLTSNPSSLTETQRRHFDGLLVQAKQELTASKIEAAGLKNEIKRLKSNFSTESQRLKTNADYWRAMYEQQKESARTDYDGQKPDNPILPVSSVVSNSDKENWDRISSLQREMQMQRHELSSEQLKREKLENQLENLQKKLKYPEKPAIVSHCTQVRKRQPRPLAKVSNHGVSKDHRISPPKTKKQSREERRIQKERRSDPIDQTCVTVRTHQEKSCKNSKLSNSDRLNRTYSEFGHHDHSNLLCPNCGKIYAVDEHELLLSHIDSCL